MLRSKHILLLATIVLVLFSCKKKAPPQFHKGYFGLTEGHYVVYDVMEITHDKAIAVHDTLIYQLKTKWGEIVEDNEGREANKFYRYKRNSPSDNWVLTDVWTGIIDGIRAELVEENQRIVKLVFAPTLQKNWDANAYNMMDEMDCYYRDIHRDSVVNGYLFDSTLVVEQDNSPSLIDTVRKYEMYAKNVGLIYKHWVDNHYQFSSNEVVMGYELYYKYVGSGYE